MTNSSSDAMLQRQVQDLQRQLRLVSQDRDELANKLKFNRQIQIAQEREIADLRTELQHIKENMTDE